MKIIVVILMALFGLIYSRGKKIYDEYIEEVSKDDYPLKVLLPVGLFIMDKIKYKYNTPYDNKVLSRLIEVYGKEDAKYYLEIFWANKVMYGFIGLIMASAIITSLELETAHYLVIGAVFIAIIIGPDNDLKKKSEKRIQQIRMAFPEFVNKLVLLIGAGLNPVAAWEVIVQNSEDDSPIYKEARRVITNVQSGFSAPFALEEFARSCKTTEITRFVSVLIQNIKKGGSDLSAVLNLMANESWELRKAEAKRMGEEAASKILIPLVLMMVAIFIVVGYPAIIQLNF